MKIAQVLKSKLPPATWFDYKPDDSVRIYTEKECKWCGPVKIVRAHGKEINETDGVAVKTFGVDQAIPTEAAKNGWDLQRLLVKLNIYMLGIVVGILITGRLDS